jgi:hypothetical protein
MICNYEPPRLRHRAPECTPDYREYGAEQLDGGFTLYYTNHHWFPVVWLIKLTPKEPSEGATLKARMLEQFYIDGCGHYDFVERNGLRVAKAISEEAELAYGR